MTGHVIVGTAGHVDHGKTLLTAALTGIDTDRLPEEKKRGMTIVPGFVRLDLPGDIHIGMIDVPGHEKFIKNMLAGVCGIDMALIVVAADEGVMPQTEEHVNILHLLGINKAVVAITKCDMVDDDPEWLEMVHEQVRNLLQGTQFADAPMVDVSAATGYHIPELKSLLAEAASEIKERPHVGIARIPVDRVFTKAGFGTIITGTLWAGSLKNGEELELLPQKSSLRVRGLQVHGETVQEALAGQRTAINVAGDDADRIKPGCWIAEPGLLQPTYRLDVSLDLLKNAGKLKHRMRMHIFHGTVEVSGRVRLLDRQELLPGTSCFCQLELEEPLYLLREDRLILRSWSPEITAAGATVLDPNPPRYRLSSSDTMPSISRKADRDNAQILLDLLDTEARTMTRKVLLKTAQMTEADLNEALAQLTAARRARVLGDTNIYVSEELYSRWKETLKQQLTAFYRKYPLRPGAPDAELRQKVFGRMEPRHVTLILDSMEGEGAIIRRDGMILTPGYEPVITARQKERLDRIMATYHKKMFIPPDWAELMKGFKIPAEEGQEYLVYLLEKQELIRLEEDFFHKDAPDTAANLLRAAYPDGFTVAQARDTLVTSRRYCMPILDELDRRHITARSGEGRVFTGVRSFFTH